MLYMENERLRSPKIDGTEKRQKFKKSIQEDRHEKDRGNYQTV